MGVAWIADRFARSEARPALQYLGLGIYVVAEAFIFLPLLYVAARFGGKGVIPAAALMTLIIFAGLTASVFFTRKDFSFLGPILGIASNLLMMLYLGWQNWLRLAVWLAVGLVIYAIYGRRHSALAQNLSRELAASGVGGRARS